MLEFIIALVYGEPFVHQALVTCTSLGSGRVVSPVAAVGGHRDREPMLQSSRSHVRQSTLPLTGRPCVNVHQAAPRAAPGSGLGSNTISSSTEPNFSAITSSA